MRFRLLCPYFLVISIFFAFSSCKYRGEFSTFAERSETAVAEKTPLKDRALYLRGGEDFQGGSHLLHREEIYHNTSLGLGFALERIKIAEINNNNTGIIYTLFDADPLQKHKANLNTIYIPKDQTWRDKEPEQVAKFLSLCQQQAEQQKCRLNQDDATRYLPQDNNNAIMVETFNDEPNLSLNTSSSLDGTWLVDMGLGYEVVAGTAIRAGSFLQVKSSLGTYNLRKKNIVGYFITNVTSLDKKTKALKPYPKVVLSHLTKEDCLRGGVNFAGGSYLVGKTDLLLNSVQNSFKPEPVVVLGVEKTPSSLITVKTSSGGTRQVNLRTLYIPKTNTSIQTPDAVILNFLKQCQENKTTCFLKDESYNVLSFEQKQAAPATPQSFTGLTPENNDVQLTSNGIWLVDMGMGYEIIKGPLKKGATFLTITNTDSRVYNIRPRQLFGYSIPSNETKQPLLTN